MSVNDSANDLATAFHEAGHAVIGALRGRAPIFVTIIPDGGIAGRNEFPKDWRPEFKRHLGDTPQKRNYIETRILIEVAGTVAHDLRFPGRNHDAGDMYDEQCALALIEDNACWAAGDRNGYFEGLRGTALSLLQSNWPWVEAVAHALIERKTIFMSEVMELCKGE